MNERVTRGLWQALRWDGGTTDLEALRDQDWKDVLAFCDRAQLTLVLARTVNSAPEWLRAEFDRRMRSNAERHDRLRDSFCEIAGALERMRTDYLVLKGFTQWGLYCEDPLVRVQYDFDLYCPPESLYKARDALLDLGYEALKEREEFPTDHLPVMVRKTGYQWRGDYFDPDIPFAVDLHFQFWSQEAERIAAPGVEHFWDRRARMRVFEREVAALHPADGLAYCCLHLLRHLLHGSVRPFHVYELASFLHRKAEDEAFWREWESLHPPRLRFLQAIAFRLATEWFGCRLSPVARAEAEALPSLVQSWFAMFGASGVWRGYRNKSELWLHWSLLDNRRDRLSIARRKLLPARLPGPVDAVLLPGSQINWRVRLRGRWRYLLYLVSRILFHTRTLVPALWQGLRWWRPQSGLHQDLPLFLAMSSVFGLGVYVIVLLYNLYLLDLGFREDSAGLVSTAHTAGSIAGALPAASLIARLGLRRTLALAFAALAVVSACRALAASQTALLGFAFLGGALLSIWPVAMAPAIAQLTTEARRPLGFSLFIATGISTGVLGGWLGGRLPLWVGGKQAALLFGSLLIACALPFLLRIRFAGTDAPRAAAYPRGPFIARFLAAMAVWNVATATFNPFFNMFFSRHLGTPVERIGSIYSAAQLTQVAALLMAPLLVRRLGTVNAIGSMQAATAVALAALAMASPGAWPAVAYSMYMAFQWMSEPGMYSLLMQRVATSERAGASALNMLVSFAIQAIVAMAAGRAFADFGYPPVLATAAAIGLSAALLFRCLLGKYEPPPPSPRAPPSGNAPR